MEKLREEFEELKYAIEIIETLLATPPIDKRVFREKKKDVHSEIADVLEIRNAIHENFNAFEGVCEELSGVTKFVEALIFKHNLDILEIFTIKEEKQAEKG